MHNLATNHNIKGSKGDYHCTVCLQRWKGMPRSVCPGLPLYEWGEIPDTLCTFNDLFGKGLRLAEGQKHVGLVGNQKLYTLADCVPHGLDIQFDEGKYKFLETPDGFDIWRVNGLNVPVRYDATYLTVRTGRLHQVGLYDWKLALSAATGYFVHQLVGDQDDDAQQMIESALSRRFFLGWKRIIETIVPKEVADLSRLMWASTQGDAKLLHQPELYDDAHKHTRADLLKYHACRMFAATTATSLDDVAQWRERLSPTVPNKALNKTLDKMPVGVSPSQLHRLSTIQLAQPVTNRLHLIFLLCASDHHNWGLHERTVVTASPEMIQQAAALSNRTINARAKTRVIGDLATQILDYPEPYGGDLLGLARLSQQWHEQIARTEHASGILPAETPLVAPRNVDLGALEAEGVRLLRTAGDCYDERARMRHCVHTYASKAARGRCYLFRVEYTLNGKTSQATVEVAPSGEAVQANGPENVRNAACDYGVTVLRKAFRDYQALND